MKEVLLVLAISMGFSLPLQAQSALPVQVICTKTQGVYKPICGHMKQAVSSSAEFRPAKKRQPLHRVALRKDLRNRRSRRRPGMQRGRRQHLDHNGSRHKRPPKPVFPVPYR